MALWRKSQIHFFSRTLFYLLSTFTHAYLTISICQMYIHLYIYCFWWFIQDKYKCIAKGENGNVNTISYLSFSSVHDLYWGHQSTLQILSTREHPLCSTVCFAENKTWQIIIRKEAVFHINILYVKSSNYSGCFSGDLMVLWMHFKKQNEYYAKKFTCFVY